MNRSMRFAPISSGPSGRLRFVVWYFAASGALMLAFLLFGLVHAAIVPSSELRAALAARPFGPVLAIAFYGLMLLIAWLLHHRRREGAILAGLLLLRSIVGAVSAGEWRSLDLAVNVIGLVLIVSIWGELRPIAWSESRTSGVV